MSNVLLADLVYSEEIVDRKLLDAKRHVNKDFSTIGMSILTKTIGGNTLR